MPRISPFHGLVFDVAVAGPLDQVTAPPYDVISDRRRLDYLRTSPYSVVHLDLAEGSDDPVDPDSRYARAAHPARRLGNARCADPIARTPLLRLRDGVRSSDGTSPLVRGLALRDGPGAMGRVGGAARARPGGDGPGSPATAACHPDTHVCGVRHDRGAMRTTRRIVAVGGRDPRPIHRCRTNVGSRHRMWPITSDATIASWVARRHALDRRRSPPLHDRPAVPR